MAKTTLSSKGQVVLPRIVRTQLHLTPGTELICEVQGDSVILTPAKSHRLPREHVIDPLTGLRVTKSRDEVERVSSDMVETLLEDFP